MWRNNALLLIIAVAGVVSHVAVSSDLLCATPATLPVPVITFNATQWAPCVPSYTSDARDAGFECRRVTFPALYCPNSTQDTLLTVTERRIVRGTPRNVIFLVSGGPGGSSALVAWAVGPQVAAALGDNFAIHIPALRGTYNTSSVLPKYWKDYPNSTEPLSSYVARASFAPYRAFTFTNAARDVIHMIRDAQRLYGTFGVVYQGAGFSYGTVMMQRIATLDPTLLSDYLLDGSVPQQFWQQPFIFQSENLPFVLDHIADNCARDPFCSSKSLSYPELVTFASNVASKRHYTMCMNLFAASASPGDDAGDVVFAVARALAMVSNIAVPGSLINADASLDSVQQQFVRAAIATWGNNASTTDVYLDFRVILWAFLNQMAQCSDANIGRLLSFAKAMKPVGTLLTALGKVGATLLSAAEPTGNEMLTQLLMLLGENPMNCSDALFNVVRASQSNSVVRNTQGLYDAEKHFCDETVTIQMTDAWSRSAVPTLSANVLFLNGLLDPNAGYAMNLDAYNQVTVAAGFTKVNYTHTNAGHTVISLGWSNCVGNLINGFFLKNSSAITLYETCLAAENKKTLAWSAAALDSYFDGASVWAGLPESWLISALVYTGLSLLIIGIGVCVFLCVKKGKCKCCPCACCSPYDSKLEDLDKPEEMASEKLDL